MDTAYIILVLVLVIAGWFVFTRNRFVVLRNRKEEALSDIDVQAKRRYDLIPNLIETVKGFAKQEQTVLENVTKARNMAMGNPGNQLDKAQSENMLSDTLKSLFAVSENYPDLKSNTNFLELQRELSDTENKMQAARRFYNSTVKDLNTKIEHFPSNIVATTFNFRKEKFFEVTSPAEREPVKVQF